jgi:hypothetical protein
LATTQCFRLIVALVGARLADECCSIEEKHGSGARLVQPLQQLVCGELDLLVSPLGSTVLAGDQAGSMNPAKVPIYERVPALGLISRFLVKAEVPIGVLIPSVGFKERVLITRSRLNFPPVAVEYVLPSVD